MKPYDMTSVADSYDAVAELYTRLFKDEIEKDANRRHLDEFIERVNTLPSTGVVLDAGCGPGHVAAYMANAGLDVIGVDLSPGLLTQAAIHFPDVATEIGDMRALRFDDDSLCGVLSRHSLIHMPPDNVPIALAEFSRILVTGAPLFLSFFGTASDQTHGESFDHQAATAHCLDPNVITEQLERHGFDQIDVSKREPGPSERRQFPGITGSSDMRWDRGPRGA